MELPVMIAINWDDQSDGAEKRPGIFTNTLHPQAEQIQV
jgi:hypothetical protein